MGFPNRNLLAAIVVAIIAAVALNSAISYMIEHVGDNNGGGDEPDEPGLKVDYVVDGDTIVMKNGEAIRLLCINTQEKGQHWSYEATRRLKEFIEMGNVSLVAGGMQDKDGGGRLLRFVMVGEGPNKTDVCLEMVREGYAHAFVYCNVEEYAEEYFSAEKEARENQSGMWNHSPIDIQISNITPLAYTGQDLNEEYVVIKNFENKTIDLSHWTIKDQHSQYEFPRLFLDPGKELKIHSGKGEDNSMDLYWGMSRSIWSQTGDACFLRDYQGDMADFMEYGDRIIG